MLRTDYDLQLRWQDVEARRNAWLRAAELHRLAAASSRPPHYLDRLLRSLAKALIAVGRRLESTAREVSPPHCAGRA